MNKSNNKLTFIILISIVILVSIGVICYNMSNKNNKNSEISSEVLAIKDKIDSLNEYLNEYYMYQWQNEKFLSISSYFAKQDSSLVTLEDITNHTNFEISDELKEVSFHYVKPASLLEFLPNSILETDLELMTVFTAVPVENGYYISSKYDEGGILSPDDYRKFVVNHHFEHGEIVNPLKDDPEYTNIIKAAANNNSEILNGNVKYISYDEKYAILITSIEKTPSITKQFVLVKNNNTWEVGINSLEERSDSKLAINYAYNDLNLSLLPIYEVSSFKVISDLSPFQDLLVQNGTLANKEISYSSGAGNFVYFETTDDKKLLLHISDDSNITIYEISNYKEGISVMSSLEDIPPVFILNFEN